jgi:hypothetical protein
MDCWLPLQKTTKTRNERRSDESQFVIMDLIPRIKESKENLQNKGEEEEEKKGEEEKILICNVNLMSSYKGKIEAYI